LDKPLVEVSLEQFPGNHAENEEQQKDDEGCDKADEGSEIHPIHFMTEAIPLKHPIIL
jgi:hypothetical protein